MNLYIGNQSRMMLNFQTTDEKSTRLWTHVVIPPGSQRLVVIDDEAAWEKIANRCARYGLLHGTEPLEGLELLS